MNCLNIAGYKFIVLKELPELREKLLQQCIDLNLKGKILLSEEGINISLAGMQNNIEQFQSYLREQAIFSDMKFVYSDSDDQPFRRMLVKIKKEIITMGMPAICPAEKSVPHISPQEFKQWLDEKRDVTILDTRNDYEVQEGTFVGAKDLNIPHFRYFPEAAKQQLDESLKEKPLVMFCTGGIRCEKAALALQEQGFKNVLQLERGILNYFSECGSAHFEGDCFVFDERILLKVDPDNRITTS